MDSPEPLVAGEALRVLCSYWQLTDQYLAQVSAFMQGKPSDDLNYCKSIALAIASDYLQRAEYLHKQFNPQLLRDIIGIAENRENDQQLSNAAYRILYDILRDPAVTVETVIPKASMRLLQDG